eukprot:jgi/Orpsp1_1/1185297/evm.model.c7180000093124.1
MKEESNKEIVKENEKNNKEEKVNTFGGVEIKNVSFIEIFKYSDLKEKLLIFIGIINSIIQGCVLPV